MPCKVESSSSSLEKSVTGFVLRRKQLQTHQRCVGNYVRFRISNSNRTSLGVNNRLRRKGIRGAEEVARNRWVLHRFEYSIQYSSMPYTAPPRSLLTARRRAREELLRYAFWIAWTQDGPDVFGLGLTLRRGLVTGGPSAHGPSSCSFSVSISLTAVTLGPITPRQDFLFAFTT
jgi:hypothetical protein